jgi:acyl carrier protein
MNDETLKNALIDAILEIAPEADFDVLDADDDLRAQLDLDSMDFLNVMIALHEKLGIDIPESDYPKLFTLNDAIGYLREKKTSPADP